MMDDTLLNLKWLELCSAVILGFGNRFCQLLGTYELILGLFTVGAFRDLFTVFYVSHGMITDNPLSQNIAKSRNFD